MCCKDGMCRLDARRAHQDRVCRRCEGLFHSETLHTHVHIVEKVFRLMLAEVTVSSDDEPIASARMKIAMTNIEAYLEE